MHFWTSFEFKKMIHIRDIIIWLFDLITVWHKATHSAKHVNPFVFYQFWHATFVLLFGFYFEKKQQYKSQNDIIYNSFAWECSTDIVSMVTYSLTNKAYLCVFVMAVSWHVWFRALSETSDLLKIADKL